MKIELENVLAALRLRSAVLRLITEELGRPGILIRCQEPIIKRGHSYQCGF